NRSRAPLKILPLRFGQRRRVVKFLVKLGVQMARLKAEHRPIRRHVNRKTAGTAFSRSPCACRFLQLRLRFKHECDGTASASQGHARPRTAEVRAGGSDADGRRAGPPGKTKAPREMA